jgi:hypothetical protein
MKVWCLLFLMVGYRKVPYPGYDDDDILFNGKRKKEEVGPGPEMLFLKMNPEILTSDNVAKHLHIVLYNTALSVYRYQVPTGL